MEAPKLEWMYKNSSEVVDREEYLLGKPIDRAFEQSSFGNEIEKDCLPTPVLSNSGSNVQVDVLRKLKEDPLEIIRQQEIERRKQLLKNPVKLKKLQNMLKEKQEQNGDSRKKSKKKTKSKKSSDEDSQDIDSLLTSKYLSLMKKHGIKSLSDLMNVNVDNKKKKKKKKSSKHDETSESESEEEYKNKKHYSKRKHYDSDSSDSDNEDEKKSKHHRRNHRDSSNEDFSDRAKEKSKKPHRSRSSSPHSKRFSQKGHPSQPHRSKDHRKQKDDSNDSKPHGQSSSSRPNKKSTGLSEEEKQKRLEEMMGNAKWRDELRVKNVARYKKEEAAENKDTEYNEDFLRKQMAIATSVGTVESRIKSNINNIQRSKFSMNENFARR